jgi:hypothetical protein
MPLVTREELSVAMAEDLDPALFDSHYARAIRMIRTAYNGDPEAATGHALDVVTTVCESILVRLFTNLKGVRTVGLSGISLTFGGSDAEITSNLVLTGMERAELEAVSPLGEGRSGGAFTIRPRRT